MRAQRLFGENLLAGPPTSPRPGTASSGPRYEVSIDARLIYSTICACTHLPKVIELEKQRTPTPIDAKAVAQARKHAPADELLAVVVETFEALADPTRARMLYALTQQPMCVRDLALLVGISESAISHQLRLLRDRDLVKSQRAGNVIIYSVASSHVAAIFREAEYYADHVLRRLPDHP
jgi:DNA-binding transcriptional ArsR family regulator